MNPGGILGAVNRFAVKNSPVILMSLGGASLAMSVVLSAKAVPKAAEAKERATEGIRQKYHNGESWSWEYLDTKGKAQEIFYRAKVYAPIYAPTILAFGAGIGFFLGANHIQVKRNGMLVAAYSLSENALLKYQNKVVDKLGEKAHMEVVDDIARDTIHEHPYDQKEVIVTSHGDTRCYDCLSGRYFLSDINAIRKAENTIVKRLVDEMTCTLNDFYEELDLPTTKLGEIVGWDVNDISPDFQFSPILDDDQVPCLAIDCQVGVLESKYSLL